MDTTTRALESTLIAAAIAITAGGALGCEGRMVASRGSGDGGPMREADAGAPRPDAERPDAVVPDAEGCASRAFMVETVRRPIDVVIWVDDGGSFGSARGRVSSSIGTNLAEILDAAGVDYRVILLSSATTIPAPLGTDPARFVHLRGGYSAGAGGYVFFSSATYLDMYRMHLRDGAFRVFLAVTDCENAAGTFASFEAALDANGEGAFVTGDDRNFVYNMIGNIALKTPGTTPWTPDEPIAGRGSFGSDFTNCAGPQEGAIATGGMRLGVAAANYDEIFRAMAEASITRSSLPCTFDPPEGEPVDLDYVRFRYSPGGDTTMEQELHQVDDEAACGADGGFYASMDRLVLCPTTCDTISADPDAAVRFTFECTPF